MATHNIDDEVASEMADTYDEMTVSKLRGVAKEKGIIGYSSMNKSELLEVLKVVDDVSIRKSKEES